MSGPPIAALFLAAPTNIDEDLITPGVLGLLVVVALAVALVFLVRSMNKQISKIQAPKEADLKQAEWEQRQAREHPPEKGTGETGDKGNAGQGPGGDDAPRG
jgi:hypothetical protein